ncbi:MAG: hypothetical protein K2N44_10645 [Lachnospiraceae bacterium]|nr:hypothetical protein [Lachnospiraceae bacterium]MDE7416737.1 hypothetical protein [Lachnospiraceae bacterium]
MNCEEFLRQFRDALDGKVSENMIQDNVNYYRSYINSQTAGGKSEADVLRMLGDPRLLAKTIEESSKFASGRESQGGYANEFNNGYYTNSNYGNYANYSSARGEDRTYTDAADGRRSRIPGWLITCIVVIVIVLVLSVVFHVFVILAPYIMVFLLAGFVVRAVRSWWQKRE